MPIRNRPEVRTAVHRRIRRKVRGTTARPRLAVYRSLNHIYAQVIDDEKAKTLASASTTEKTLRTKTGGNIDAAKRVGEAIAERALAAGIEQVVFDRGGYLYHGRVKALTDAARAAGLNKGEVKEAEAAAETTADETAAAEASAEVKPAKAKVKKEPKAKAEPKEKPKAKDQSGAKEKPSAKAKPSAEAEPGAKEPGSKEEPGVKEKPSAKEDSGAKEE
jgi:large subunit ribosomal protein L18